MNTSVFNDAIVGSSMYYRMPLLQLQNTENSNMERMETINSDVKKYSVTANINDICPVLEAFIDDSKHRTRLSNDNDFKNGEISNENAMQAMMSTLSTLNISLFSDVIFHCLRVSRALANDATHVIIVGISGTGKQSIAKLACIASGFVV